VSDRGTPVQFTSEEIKPGKAVDAIGHPSGLEFTLTRGVVSAVVNGNLKLTQFPPASATEY
jgi:S1-C subfamily serine protease